MNRTPDQRKPIYVPTTVRRSAPELPRVILSLLSLPYVIYDISLYVFHNKLIYIKVLRKNYAYMRTDDIVHTELNGLRVTQNEKDQFHSFSAPNDSKYNYKYQSIRECSSLNQGYKYKFCINRHVAMHNYIYFKNQLDDTYVHKSMHTNNESESDSQSMTTLNSHILQNYTSIYDSESNESNSMCSYTQFSLDDTDEFEESNFNYQTFLNVGIQMEMQNYSD